MVTPVCPGLFHGRENYRRGTLRRVGAVGEASVGQSAHLGCKRRRVAKPQRLECSLYSRPTRKGVQRTAAGLR
jgi:hypothetical protein